MPCEVFLKYLIALCGLAALTSGCASAHATAVDQFQEGLSYYRASLVLSASFEDYLTHLNDKLEKSPEKILTLKPVVGSVSSDYGSRRLQFERLARPHTGIDFRAASGAPVVASGAGVVVFAGWRGAYGRAVIIDHGSGLTTLYGHMRVTLVKPGQKIPAGGLIGQVGSTGRSTGPHLHFEARIRNLPVDPKEMVTWM